MVVPARLSSDGHADPRVSGANRLFHDVVALVRAAGLDPLVVTDPGTDLDGVAGVVLPGGGDLDPDHYGGEPSEAVYDIHPEQDALDLGLARTALEHGLPVLGICRGAQVLNVAAGGTLVADLPPTEVAHVRVPEPGEQLAFVWHPVRLRPSRLRDELGGVDSISVGSGHHQGVDQLAEALTATAVADDGLVEAFEDASGRVLGVQWHPEASDTPAAEQNAPFRLFARAVAEQERTSRA
ncbi:putative glutamine amidotransferase [Auraticoccus monumenti]|uniref:Putative glutamine amidotransferase n=1 Tax=Auraticoccus monumenti TaxID=675864 RepID=A0A1G6T3N4_9ACTN|nr:putative glutamine amidotransferase [Auraticoccus monumenti]